MVDTVNEGFIAEWFVEKKHPDLKNEFLFERSLKMGPAMWDYLEQHANNLMRCERVKKMRAHGLL